MAGTRRCEKCGDEYSEGDWPFCASERNPEGHKRGSYQFGVAGGGGAMKKWTHTGTKSPR